jgi:hypothetical protein
MRRWTDVRAAAAADQTDRLRALCPLPARMKQLDAIAPSRFEASDDALTGNLRAYQARQVLKQLPTAPTAPSPTHPRPALSCPPSPFGRRAWSGSEREHRGFSARKTEAAADSGVRPRRPAGNWLRGCWELCVHDRPQGSAHRAGSCWGTWLLS